MSQFTPISGIVTNLAVIPTDRANYSSCALTLTIQDTYGNQNTVILEPCTYVLNQAPIRAGDMVIAFYDNTAPMPLIYPPRYRAVAMVKPAHGQSAVLDVFDRNMVNSDNTLKVTVNNYTEIRTQNGQILHDVLGGQLMLIIFGATTRSIPAQTTAESITVFCTT